MGEHVRTIITVVLAILVFLILYKNVAMKWKTRKQRFIDKAERLGNYTTAVCTNTKRRYGDGESGNRRVRRDSLVVTYVYRVNGREFKKKVTYYQTSTFRIDFPYQTKVYFNPLNPRKCYCKYEASEVESRQKGCFLTAILTIFSIAVIYNILLRF